jgi:putative phosphotransacetylase
MKWLYQKDQFAAKETVTLIGPRSRVISNLRILGPCRISTRSSSPHRFHRARLRHSGPPSGNIKGTPGCMLMGPERFLRNARRRHPRRSARAHAPDDAAFYGVKPAT